MHSHTALAQSTHPSRHPFSQGHSKQNVIFWLCPMVFKKKWNTIMNKTVNLLVWKAIDLRSMHVVSSRRHWLIQLASSDEQLKMHSRVFSSQRSVQISRRVGSLNNYFEWISNGYFILILWDPKRTLNLSLPRYDSGSQSLQNFYLRYISTHNSFVEN